MSYIYFPSTDADLEVSDESRIFPQDWDTVAGEWLISHSVFIDVSHYTGNCKRCSRFGKTGGSSSRDTR